MSAAAARVLAAALASHPELARSGWDHFATAMTDAGRSCFLFDRGTGSAELVTLRVYSDGAVEVSAL